MIDRYSRPAMKKVWSEENKYEKWLEVEIAVCEAWAELGAVPRNAIPKIKMAKVNLKRMQEILEETHHDVTAFIGSVAESLGPASPRRTSSTRPAACCSPRRPTSSSRTSRT